MNAPIVKSVVTDADIAAINRLTVREMMPDEVYCFSVAICDNEVDRDNEMFSVKTINELAPMMTGKTMVIDHRWSAENQMARLYKTWVETTEEKTSYNMPFVRLMGSAYIPITEETQPVIDKIDAGILKEVSIGCQCKEQNCSICGSPLTLNWRTWERECEGGHVKGQTYDGKMCAGVLDKPTDAFEVSFCAVPVQRAAGVTKAEQDAEIEGAFDALDAIEVSDMSRYENRIERLMPKFKAAAMSAEERAQRQALLQFARGL